MLVEVQTLGSSQIPVAWVMERHLRHQGPWASGSLGFRVLGHQGPRATGPRALAPAPMDFVSVI